MAKGSLKRINTIGFYLFIFLIFSYQKEKMFFYDQEIILNYFNYLYAPVLLCIIGFAYFIIYRDGKSVVSVSRGIKRFVLFITIISFFTSLFFPMKAKVIYIYILILSLTYSYSTIFPRLISNKTYVIGIIALFISLLYIYISRYSVQVVNQLNSQTNASYTLLYILPLLLCIKNKTINITSIIVTLIVVSTSLKRGGLLAFSFGIIAYLYIKYISLPRSNNRIVINTITLLGTLGLLFMLILYVNNSTDGIMLERFASISDDEGSGRIGIWERVLTLISQSSFFGLLFGHGWDAVYRDMGISAHNDFLEIFYDFGVIAFVLFMLMLYRLFKYAKYLVHIQSGYAPVLVCSLAIFCVNSMVSHIVIYPHYFMLFLICWGYILSYKNT